MDKLYCKLDELAKLYCKLDELVKLYCKFDELAKLRHIASPFVQHRSVCTKNGFRAISFEYIVLDSYSIHI